MRHYYMDKDKRAMENVAAELAATTKRLELLSVKPIYGGTMRGDDRVRKIRERLAGVTEGERIDLFIHAAEDIRWLLEEIDDVLESEQSLRTENARERALRAFHQAMAEKYKYELHHLHEKVGRQRVILKEQHRQLRGVIPAKPASMGSSVSKKTKEQ